MTKQGFNSLENNALLLDVRPADIYAQGHIKGSTNQPLEDFATADLPADKNQPIYVYCRLGIKSKEAKAVLEKKGYTNVEDMGSLDDMIACGFDYVEEK